MQGVMLSENPFGVRTLPLCACEFWSRFRSRHGRGLPWRRAPLDAGKEIILGVNAQVRHPSCRFSRRNRELNRAIREFSTLISESGFWPDLNTLFRQAFDI